MTFVGLIFRNVVRRRQRSLLTLLAVAVCLFLFVCQVTVLETLDSMVARSRTHRRVIVHARTSMGITMPIAYQARLERIPGVEAVMSMVLLLSQGRSESLLVGACAVDPLEHAQVMYEQQSSPEVVARFQATRTGALVAWGIADHDKLKVGDRFTIHPLHIPATFDLEVSGITTGNLNPTTLFFHRKYFTEKVGDHGAALFFLKVSDLDSVTRVVDTVEREFDGDPIPVTAAPEHAMVTSFMVAQGTVLTLVRSVGLLVLLCITLVVGNGMAMAVRERTPEVGVLKALGFTGAHVTGILVTEALLVSLVGALLGCLGAWALLATGFAAGHGPLSSLTLRPRTLLAGVAAGLLVGLVGGWVPARRAAGRSVLDCLRRVV